MATPNNNLSEFDVARRRLEQNIRAQRQREEQQIKRQFARTGGTGSGAYLKQLQLAGERAQTRQSEGQFAIGAAESAEKRRLEEIQKGREFAASEAQKQREFQTGESALAREFAKRQGQIQREFITGENLQARQAASREAELGRSFASSENSLQRAFQTLEAERQRGFATSEAEKGRDFAQQLEDAKMAFQQEVFKAEKQSRLDQLELQKQQLDFEKDIAEFNKQIATAELNKPTDLFSSIYGGGSGTTGALAGAGIGFALGGPVGALVGSFGGSTLGNVFCFLKDTMVKIADGTLKKIQDISLGEKLSNGVTVNAVAQAFANDDIYKIDGEFCTGMHVILDRDNKWKFVKDIERSEKTDLPKDTIVYPLNTDLGHFVTGSGNISLSYMNVEGAINPEDELRILNAKNPSSIVGVNTTVKQLLVSTQLLELLEPWFAFYNWAPLEKDLYPKGTNFLCFLDGVPAVYMNYYKTNSRMVVQGYTIANPKITGFYRSLCLDECYKAVRADQERLGFKCAYYATDKNSEPMVNYLGRKGWKTTSNGDGFILIDSLTGINTDCLEDKDYEIKKGLNDGKAS